MRKRFWCRLILYGLLLAPYIALAATKIDFQIKGVDGVLLANVQSRLQEFSQSTTDTHELEAALPSQIAQSLYPYGYFSPEIQIHPITKDKFLIQVQTGPLMRIRTLTLRIIGQGKNNALLLQAIQTFPLHQNDVFNSLLYEKAKRSLILAAEREGFLHASFDEAKVLINKKEHSATVHLVLNTSFRFYFGSTTFSQSLVSDSLLHRYMPFQEGMPYSNKALLAFNRALSQSGYFKDVMVLPKISDKPFVPIDVVLVPAMRKTYAFGLGYGTDTGPRGRVDFRMSPVNHFGHQFTASILGSMKENRFLLDYAIPGAHPLVDRYNLMSSFSTLNYASGYANSLLATAAARHVVPQFQRILSVNELYERFNYQDAPKEDIHAFFPKATFAFINRKEGLFSPSGYHLTLTGLAAHKSFLSNLSFSQVALDTKAALTWEPLRMRFYFHSLVGFTKVDDIYRFPLSLALLLGGADTMKAYSLNAIGPGKTVYYGGFEVQKETWDKWYLTGFIDRGTSFNPIPRNWLTDYGVGLMWLSPVGPIKIGLAQAVDNHWAWQKDGWHLVINMGPDL